MDDNPSSFNRYPFGDGVPSLNARPPCADERLQCQRRRRIEDIEQAQALGLSVSEYLEDVCN